MRCSRLTTPSAESRARAWAADGAGAAPEGGGDLGGGAAGAGGGDLGGYDADGKDVPPNERTSGEGGESGPAPRREGGG